MILRARVLLPLSQPAIEDGVVCVSGDRITRVGRWSNLSPSLRKEAVDLVEMIILPGLINAHCHLDYTDMAGQLTSPRTFPDWIKALLALKAQWTYSDYAESWVHGARMLLRNGVTTVADIEAVPELLPEVWEATPLRVFSFLEITGVKSRRAPRDILRESTEKIESLAKYRNSVGLSPHAPYSTTPELLRLSGRVARRKKWRVTTHVAESAPEFDMYRDRRGTFFEWLKNQRDMSDCGLGSPVEHLERQGLLGENLLAVHANYLGPNDARLLGERGVSVVHCPRSHAFFRHQPFPHEALVEAGVNVSLGTDSLASVQKVRGQVLQLNCFEEMRAFSLASPGLAPEKILSMATLNGAQALGWAGKIGELSEGSFADLIAIPFPGKASQACDAVLHHPGEVASSMIAGEWAIRPELD